MGQIYAQVYKPLKDKERARLAAWLALGAGRARRWPPEEGLAMRQALRDGLLALPEDVRARLQALNEKAVTAALAQPRPTRHGQVGPHRSPRALRGVRRPLRRQGAPRRWGPAHRAIARSGVAEVQELFTRDVTGKGLQELLGHETQRPFASSRARCALGDLKGRPWYRRYPLTGWRVFLAVAHRLTPWRRVLFAVSVPVVALAWFRYIVAPRRGRASGPFRRIFSLQGWLLLAATFLFFLLVLELRDKLGLKGDLEIARQIQFGLLPFAPYAAAASASRR